MRTQPHCGRILQWTLAVLLLAVVSVGAAEAPRPNIVFILCDDLGFGDLGVFYQNLRREQGDRSKPWHLTPQIDAFAKEGIELPHHYCAAPVCAPSRASLLLGVTQGHANVRDNQFDKALENNHTLASVLKKAGYATAAIGKWGLQGKTDAPPVWPAHPLERGFDDYYGYIRHVDGHAHYPKEDGKEVWENLRNVAPDLDKCYTTDLFTARAKHWITDRVRTKPQQPFFLYLAFDTPHAKLQLPPCPYPSGGGTNGGLQWLGQPGHMINTATGTVDGWTDPAYASATWDHDHDPATPEQPWPDVFKRHATDVRRIDHCIGDLVQLLKDLLIDENTLVVFTSDNGPSRESYLPENYEPTFFSSFGPFDGIKRDCWEGGVRVGALVRWPGGIRAGTTSSLPSGSWDWLPTFAELAGVPPPARTDGRSLVPTLTGHGAQRRPNIYLEYFEGGKTPDYRTFETAHRDRRRRQMQAIRLGDFMGVRYNVVSHKDDFEIYDIVHDPKESTDLAAKHPELQQQMKDAVLGMRRPDAGAPRPYDNEAVPAVPVSAPLANQIDVAVYEGRWPWVPDFDALTPNRTTTMPALDVAKAGKTDNFGLRFSGWFIAPTDGDYTFQVRSDAGATLRLHETLVIDDDFGHDGSIRTGSIRLKAGLHPFRLFYRHAEGTPVLHLEYSGPDIPLQAVPATAFCTVQ
jgi:arylsulfatase A-like enzyme